QGQRGRPRPRRQRRDVDGHDHPQALARGTPADATQRGRRHERRPRSRTRGPPMTTTPSLRRTIIAVLALVVIGLTASAHPAGAATLAPAGPGSGAPKTPPPVASFTVSPNPALVNTLPVATTSTTISRALVASGPAITMYGNGDNVTFNASASHGTGGI